jgi:hypothetical protein
MVHRTRLTVGMVTRARRARSGRRRRRTERRWNSNEQRELEHEPAGGDAPEPRSEPVHQRARLARRFDRIQHTVVA